MLAWASCASRSPPSVATIGTIVRVVRGWVGRAWLGPAKALLDLGLVRWDVVRIAFRSRRPDAARTVILEPFDDGHLVVDDSLGSVIALDSLNQRTGLAADRSRLARELGLPIAVLLHVPPWSVRVTESTRRWSRSRAGWSSSSVDVLPTLRRRRGTVLGRGGRGLDPPTRKAPPAHADDRADDGEPWTILDGLLHAEAVAVNGCHGSLRGGHARAWACGAAALCMSLHPRGERVRWARWEWRRPQRRGGCWLRYRRCGLDRACARSRRLLVTTSTARARDDAKRDTLSDSTGNHRVEVRFRDEAGRESR